MSKTTVYEEAGVPAAMTDLYSASANVGLEEADSESFAVPFLKLLQTLSPEVDKEKGDYVEGAEKGQFMNSVTKELYDGEQGRLLVPCYYRRRFIQWAPRNTGGGFRGVHTPAQAALIPTMPDEKGRPIMENGDLLQDTREHYCLSLSEDGKLWDPVIVALASTQRKKSKNWNSIMKQFKLPDGRTYPTFARKYRVTRVVESKNEDQWYGWKIENDEMVTDEALFNDALEFANAIRAGEVKPADPVETVPEDDAF